MSTTGLRHLEVGLQETYDADNPEPLLIDLPQMTLGYQGTPATVSGSHSAMVVRATLSTTPVVICSTGAQPHFGKWRFRSRVSVSATTVYVRLSWRVGEGPFTAERWVEVPAEDDWYDPLLAVLKIAQAEAGSHTWEGHLEAYATTGTPTIDVDYFGLMPADQFSLMRAPLPKLKRNSFVARDGFTQSAGSLTGKTADSGGTWAGLGSATDFAIDTSADTITRTATSDPNVTNHNGRICTLGPAIDNQIVQFDFKSSYGGPTDAGISHSFIGRLTDIDNFFAVDAIAVWSDGEFGIDVQKYVGGSRTTHPKSGTRATRVALAASTWYTGRLAVYSDGVFAFWLAKQGFDPGDPLVVGYDAELASDGALATGKGGLHDQNLMASAATRTYDNFTVAASDSPPVKFPGRSVTLTHESTLSESEDGSTVGRVPAFEGQYLTLPPATRAGNRSRIVTKGRRLDVDDGLPDIGLEDQFTASMSVTPRVLTTSRRIAQV